MSSSIRYNYVRNVNAGALTVDNFPVSNDGDDKQYKIVKRIISAGDIGIGAGQLGDPYGAIVDIIPMTSTVLWLEGNVYRGGVVQQGMTPYNPIDNQIDDIPPTTSCEVLYGVGLDNTIRVIDKGHDTDFPLAVGDIVSIKLIIGTRQNPLDVMNP